MVTAEVGSASARSAGLSLRWRARSGRLGRCIVAIVECQHQGPASGGRFPADVITSAVRWYLRYGLSYRDVEELLAERGVDVDHVTIYRWVQRFTPRLIDAARPCRHSPADRWCVDETYVKVAGRWVYLYRAIDQLGRSSTCSCRISATRALETAGD